LDYDFYWPYRGRLFVYGTQPVGEGDSYLRYWLQAASLRVTNSLASKLDEWDLVTGEWAVLQELYRPGRSNPVAVARVLGMSKGAASKLIDRLVTKRLVKRTAIESDRRSCGVELTSLGKIVVPVLATLEDDIEREFFGQLPTKTYDNLRDTLIEVARKVQTRRQSVWELPRVGPRRRRQLA
jgi:DNA-binding MarR family transcriptional regulator